MAYVSIKHTEVMVPKTEGSGGSSLLTFHGITSTFVDVSGSGCHRLSLARLPLIQKMGKQVERLALYLLGPKVADWSKQSYFILGKQPESKF